LPDQVAVFATRYPPAFRGGGPIRTLEALVEQAPPVYSVLVVTRDSDQGSSTRLAVERNVWVEKGSARVRYTTVEVLAHLIRSMREVRRARPDLVYVNSFFDFKLSILPQLLARIGYFRRTRLLVAPRGEFGEAALMHRALKKRLFLYLFRLLRMQERITWHASSDQERSDVARLWGASARVLVRENETLLPEQSDSPALPSASTARRTRYVSVGRLVEHKGLHVVLAGLKELDEEIDLDVYGPAEDDVYVKRCKGLVAELPANVSVRFNGTLPHSEVRQTLAMYDALLMPTAGENFGHIIAEALSVSCPVFAPATTPWTQILADGGGVVVESRTSAAWSLAIKAHASIDQGLRFLARRHAGASYDAWKASSTAPHVFDLVFAND